MAIAEPMVISLSTPTLISNIERNSFNDISNSSPKSPLDSSLILVRNNYVSPASEVNKSATSSPILIWNEFHEQ